MAEYFTVLGDIDWNLLHKQKMALLRATEFENIANSNDKELLEGLLELIDAMQDWAEDQSLWNFPETELT